MFLIYDKEIDQSVIGSVYLHPPAEKLVSSLSYPHICEIMQVEPPVKRLFYETECIKGCWSVRERLSYAHTGQMSMYLNWFAAHMMTEGDNPPVGLVLCPGKNAGIAEYATAGLPHEVFVSKYEVVLPRVEDVEEFLAGEIQVLREQEPKYWRGESCSEGKKGYSHKCG